MADPLLVDRDGAVVTLTLNRPDALNALDVPLKLALRDAVEEIRTDHGVRAVVLAGAGRAFCVGQDLREHVESLGGPQPLSTVAEHYNPLVLAIARLDRPVVAAVRGMAAGAGASLAFLADLRVGGPKTAFLMAFANVGLAADTGASWTLPRLVGRAKATELLMLAEPVGAAEALRLGLLTRLVDDDEQARVGSDRGLWPDQARVGRGREHDAGRRPRGGGAGAGRLRRDRRPPQRHGRLRGQAEAGFRGPLSRGARRSQRIDRKSAI